MEPIHYASCQATLFEKLSNHSQNFCLSAWDDRSFDSDVLLNENKTESLLNKIINTGTNYSKSVSSGSGQLSGQHLNKRKIPMPDTRCCASFVCVFTRNNKSERPESIGTEFIRNRICQHSV